MMCHKKLDINILKHTEGLMAGNHKFQKLFLDKYFKI